MPFGPAQPCVTLSTLLTGQITLRARACETLARPLGPDSDAAADGGGDHSRSRGPLHSAACAANVLASSTWRHVRQVTSCRLPGCPAAFAAEQAGRANGRSCVRGTALASASSTSACTNLSMLQSRAHVCRHTLVPP